jgi:muramoyltetrapeptide carboxypeptidase
MQRRDFFLKTGLAALSPALPTNILQGETPDEALRPRLKKAARIREGATVGLVSIGYALSDIQAENSLKLLQKLGFKAKPGANWLNRKGYLAGTDAERLSDLHAAFADPEVEVVWCARGGYGTTRLLPYINYDLIRRNPKPVIGYSDITALHAALGVKTGLVTFHGPGTASDVPDFALEHWRAVLQQGKAPHFIVPETPALTPAHQVSVIRSGKAVGRTVGGNLTLLASLAGTPYSPSYKGKIVFLEDIDERPYRIDRMLTQLLQSTDLAEAAGLALGVFIDCEAKSDSSSFTLMESLKLCLENLPIPIVYGLPIGHMPRQATIPCGVMAELDTNTPSLTLLESGVV